ncbi:lipopolysaccharide biosynthesis protein [Vibrio breoganii]
MTVALGTAGAQVIALLSTPIITRIYEPSVIGQAGLFFSICAIFTQISNLCYSNAIVIPKNDRVAKIISGVSIWISLILSLLLLLFTLLFGHKVEIFQNMGGVIYIIPFMVITSAFSQIYTQWEVRKGNFKTISIVTFLNSIWINLGKVSLAFINPSFVFITAPLIFSYALQIVLYRKNRKLYFPLDKKKQILSIARKYSAFPFYKAPQVLLFTLSESMPIYFLTKSYGSSEAAFYVLAKSILGIPLMLIGKSIGDVFYPKFVSIHNNKGNTYRLALNFTSVLFFISLFPAVVIYFKGEVIFGFVLGQDWSKSGEYAAWMTIWFVSNFMNKPSVISIPVVGKQKQQFLFELIALLLRASFLYYGVQVFSSGTHTIALYSITNAVLNILLISWLIIYLKRNQN